MARFKSIEPTYTGGGIYLFTGQLADGNYFMADTSFYDVRILTDDPWEITIEHSMFPEYAMDSVEWQEEHLVEDLEPEDAAKFILSAIRWVTNHKPEGNYSLGDFKYYIDDLKRLAENKTEVWTVYAEADDMTFVMEGKADGSISVVGFYFGKPDAESTEYFKGKTTAVLED